jgi:hypothetical protein
MKAPIITILIYAYFTIAWIINLIQFCSCDFKEPYKREIIKGVGLAGFSFATVWIANDEK